MTNEQLLKYVEIMRKIMDLSGWTWEWKFGDRAFCTITNKEVVVFSTSGKVAKVLFQYDGFGLAKIDALIPLPTVEQFDKLFTKAGYDLHVERRGTCFIVAAANRDTMERHENNCHGSILMRSIAELYARVVLGYKWDGKEFGKC